MHLQVAADDGDALVDGQTSSLIRSIHQPVFAVNDILERLAAAPI
jgi:hypothetical protein